ncbi:hypothetical protein CTEN210_06406 [Chaetoceros tenuissimus]|uniref:YrhK domain-containing protein n=1 Tax=Chaetoceros tenuissimus TaxID=426638 RepID=A0AAD3CRW4_9STRA|nr:hypothetical protein CTEN210_06406 [Chaetoceros tenuissimus]
MTMKNTPIAETTLEMVKHISFFHGGLLFLLGSICFYPSMYDITILSIHIGAWCFIVGCAFFAFASILDFIQHMKLKYSSTDQIVFSQDEEKGRINTSLSHKSTSSMSSRDNSSQDETELNKESNFVLAKAIISFANIFAAMSFLVGAVYFLPRFYEQNERIGCYGFIIGCIILCLSSSYMILALRESIWQSTSTLIGSILFIVGSIFFLPEYLVLEGGVVLAVNFFIIGSIFFTLTPMIDIWIVLRATRYKV